MVKISWQQLFRMEMVKKLYLQINTLFQTQTQHQIQTQHPQVTEEKGQAELPNTGEADSILSKIGFVVLALSG